MKTITRPNDITYLNATEVKPGMFTIHGLVLAEPTPTEGGYLVEHPATYEFLPAGEQIQVYFKLSASLAESALEAVARGGARLRP